MSFIDQLAKKILSEHFGPMQNTTIVLPGRRSGLFLKNSLAKMAGKAILLPQIVSIEDYIFEASQLRKMEETSLLTKLFSVYKQKAGADAFPLDEFLNTGKTLLADFNDVDDYILNPEDVFTYLFRIKEIEGWIPGEANTGLQKQFMAFYTLLNPIYNDFRKILLDNGMGYQGLASRMLAEADLSEFPFQHVVFAGLNAITPSLAQHIDKLLLIGKASLIWDNDNYYLGKTGHEAGHFMRMNKNRWPLSFDEPTKMLETDAKKINFIGAPLGYSQVQTGLSILSEKYSDAFAETVLVLADESLLMPLLSSLPKEWADMVNISSGYPLKNTLVGQLLISYLELITRSVPDTGNSKSFHRDNLTRFIFNPLLALIVDDENKENFRTNCAEIANGSTRFFRRETNDGLIGRLNSNLFQLLSEPSNWAECLNQLKTISERIFDMSYKVDLEHEAAWMCTTMLTGLSNNLANYTDSSELSIDAALFFVKKQLHILKIPLKGEPLKGIQILGMLETRALDFKNVIVLGVNEGFLPASGHIDSFLPYDVRRELGLPLPFERDAVYAYHFYRLMQRANEITLIYNTESDPIYGKEPSRYLAQIEHELCRNNQTIQLEKQVLGISYHQSTISQFVFPDRNIIDNALTRIAEKGLSFTGFFTFVECPRKFLVERILGIKETNEVAAEMGNDVMGNIFHKAIETISRPYIGKKLSESDVENMLADVPEQLQKSIAYNQVVRVDRGYNYLVADLLNDSLIRWLKGLKSVLHSNHTIVDVEADLSSEIVLHNNRKVKLIGFADRVEQTNDGLRIMDFKTTHKAPNLKISAKKTIADYFVSDRRYLIQVLFYASLYAKKHRVSNITGGVYAVLSNHNHLPLLITGEKGEILPLSNNLLEQFNAEVENILEDLFDETQNFEPTPGKACNYCPYNDVLCFKQAFKIGNEDGEE